MSEEKTIINTDTSIEESSIYTPRKIITRSDMIDACESIGKQIGHYCYEKDKSLLYDLRRCKRYERFLEVLDRLKGKIPNLGTDKKFLSYLDNNKLEWREYKSFISIFAKDLMFSIEYAKSKSQNR